MVDALAGEPALVHYPHRHAVRGDLLARLSRHAEARQEFERAAGLTRNEDERRLFRARAAAADARATADIDGGATLG